MAGETCKCGARLRDDGSCPWGCPKPNRVVIDFDALSRWTPYEGAGRADADESDERDGRWWR
jgi:hypothetical protein